MKWRPRRRPRRLTFEPTGRSIKALVDNLRPHELDLPFEFCECWWKEGLAVSGFAVVTQDRILVHRTTL